MCPSGLLGPVPQNIAELHFNIEISNRNILQALLVSDFSAEITIRTISQALLSLYTSHYKEDLELPDWIQITLATKQGITSRLWTRKIIYIYIYIYVYVYN